MATKYCEVDEVKEAGRLNVDGVEYDATLDSFILTVSEWIDQYCRRLSGAFAVSANTTRYYYPDDVRNGVLTLDTTILSVNTLTNGDGNALASGAYRLHPRNQPRYYQIHLLDSYSWLWNVDGEIAISGKFGYSLTPPAPVREATIQFTAWLFKRYQAALQDASASFELGQLVYSKKIPDTVLALLDLYIDRSKIL